MTSNKGCPDVSQPFDDAAGSHSDWRRSIHADRHRVGRLTLPIWFRLTDIGRRIPARRSCGWRVFIF